MEKTRYRAKVYPLYAGRKRVDDWSWEYTKAYSVNQAFRNFGMRYPYPHYIVVELVVDPDKTG